MLHIKDAAKLATEFVKEILPTEVHAAITLEEIELDPTGEFWLVTVGLPTGRRTLLSDQMSNLQTARELKVVRIRREDGEVLGLHIRD
ncbi:MAG: hypothetical protein R3C71_14545 [Candidatus Krumholzibacteriia bacterium]|nr:hypothetical protein [bacterium]MCB9513437.1 hypothetical protein [Candidatus Latescibacterota bacterium]MCB9516151.1 hypothetical protein [Candidatus Latescibacterota bacterium]